MKKEIHPQYFEKAKAVCSCGQVFTIGSTKEYMEVETCSACHPFYTGQKTARERVGQVQKFRKRLALRKTQDKQKSK